MVVVMRPAGATLAPSTTRSGHVSSHSRELWHALTTFTFNYKKNKNIDVKHVKSNTFHNSASQLFYNVR